MDVIRLENHEHVAPQPRSAIAGFDALRAFAAIAVVALHAGVPYLRHPMLGLVWPVMDSRSRAVDVVFWTIEVVVMPLFLMIAGFLLWRSSLRLSPSRLVKSRARRLLVPLAFGVLIVLPIDLFIWTLGLVAEGTVPPIKLKSYKFAPPISDQIWGLAHLWFLLYVFLYAVVAACVVRFCSSDGLQRIIAAVAKPKLIAASLGCAAIATLAIAPDVVWGFQHAFLPVPSKWIYSGMFFAAGCVLAFYDGDLKWVAKESPRLLSMAALLVTSSVLLGMWFLERCYSGQSVGLAANFLLATLTVGAASATTLGLIGASKRYVKQVSGPVRYLASASYWIYIVHHPLLGLVHYDLKWAWPSGSPFMKLCVSLVATVGISLLMYQGLIHRTWVGTLLGIGPQGQTGKTPVETQFIALPIAESPERRAA